MENPPANPSTITGGAITNLGDDLLHNILAKLPAQSFAIAACVNRSWNTICTRILSRPNLCSAISLNPSLDEAVNEVVGKVLSGPIRPHFAILCIHSEFHLGRAHRLITEKLGSSVPVVTCETCGVIGKDALTDRFVEVNFSNIEDLHEYNKCRGISLTVGYVPGIKVDAIPLSLTSKGPSYDKFVMDVKDYSASVSGCTSPEAMIMFGDSEADMNPALEKLDYAFSKQSIVAGYEKCRFMYRNIDKTGRYAPSYGAVALVFARDKDKLDGLGKIEFHFAVGAGVTARGPTYKVVSARRSLHAFSTWLTAKRQGENVTLDGQQLLDDVDVENLECDLYIGVTKRRKCSVGSEKVKSVTSLTYHAIVNTSHLLIQFEDNKVQYYFYRADEEYLYVSGCDIKTGDSFRFYGCDPEVALRSCATVSENFRGLKDREIIGSFIFACCGRDSTFFDKSNVDTAPILDNFPNAPLAGMFCSGEIARGALSNEGQEQGSAHCFLHVYSSVYLVMSYCPPCRL